MRGRFSLAAAVVVAALGASATPANAAGWRCEASAARASVLGQAALEPIVANKGQVLCREANATGNSGLPAPLGAVALGASTRATGSVDKPGDQAVTATGGLVDFGLRILPDLPIKLPVNDVIENVAPVSVPLPAVPLLPGSPSSVSVDLRPALRAALPNGGLPDTDLVRVRAAVAYASGRCVNGAPVLDGQSRVAGVSLLGQELPLNGLVTQTLDLVGGKSIDPSNLDVSKLGLPPGIAPELLPVIQTAVKPVLDALPNIEIPATVAQIAIQPGQQIRTANQIVQRALTVSISILGQRLTDAVIGEAVIGQDDVVCTTGPTSVAQAALQCTTRRLVLTDVVSQNGRVVLTGAADKHYIGKTVRIFFPHQRKYVASAKVRKDGTFRTTAALPARKLRGTNLARYQARIGKERSLRLKLERRMAVRSVRVSGGNVRISGRVLRPLAAPARTITITRRVSCTKSAVVARVKPNSKGEFSVTVKAPPKTQAAVYRLSTRVRKTMKNPKTFPTFTLPRYVDLDR
jgi:hypothetical protein